MLDDMQRLTRDTEPGRVAASWGIVAVAQAPSGRQVKLWKVVVPLLTVVLFVAGGLYYRSHQSKRLTEKDTIVLTDFANSTGGAGFDDTFKKTPRVFLRQTPFLNVLLDSEVAKGLKLMTRPAHSRNTPEN